MEPEADSKPAPVKRVGKKNLITVAPTATVVSEPEPIVCEQPLPMATTRTPSPPLEPPAVAPVAPSGGRLLIRVMTMG